LPRLDERRPSCSLHRRRCPRTPRSVAQESPSSVGSSCHAPIRHPCAGSRFASSSWAPSNPRCSRALSHPCASRPPHRRWWTRCGGAASRSDEALRSPAVLPSPEARRAARLLRCRD
jgi:hypothetical protein